MKMKLKQGIFPKGEDILLLSFIFTWFINKIHLSPDTFG